MRGGGKHAGLTHPNPRYGPYNTQTPNMNMVWLPSYSNWGHTLKSKLEELIDPRTPTWVTKEGDNFKINISGKSVKNGTRGSVENDDWVFINFLFGNTPPSLTGRTSENAIEESIEIELQKAASVINLPNLNTTFLEKCELLATTPGLHKEKVALIFADPGKNDVDDTPATLALIKNFGEVLLFDCSGKNEYTTQASRNELMSFATDNECTLHIITDHKYESDLLKDIKKITSTHVECFLLCAFSDDKTKEFIGNYLTPFVLSSKKEGYIFNFNIYGDINPEITMGDPIGELNLNSDLSSVEKLMGFLLDSTLQTHNIGSNLRMGAKYYAVLAPSEEDPAGRPAQTYKAWNATRPGYMLTIDAKDPTLLLTYKTNRERLKSIMMASNECKNYNHKKEERKATNYLEVQLKTGLPLKEMIGRGAFPNTALRNPEVISGFLKHDPSEPVDGPPIRAEKDLADLSFVLSYLFGGDNT